VDSTITVRRTPWSPPLRRLCRASRAFPRCRSSA